MEAADALYTIQAALGSTPLAPPRFSSAGFGPLLSLIPLREAVMIGTPIVGTLLMRGPREPR